MHNSKLLCKKNELWSLIRRLGRIYNEDEEFIKEYAKEVYNANIEDIDRAIECFKDLIVKAGPYQRKKLKVKS